MGIINILIIKMSELRLVKLSSKEGHLIECERDVAEQSLLIKNMLEDITDDEDCIPIPDVSTEVLEKVLEFCKYQQGKPDLEIERPIKTNKLADIVPAWYAAYVEVEHRLLVEIITAANHLDIKSLLDLACTKVACMIKDRSPEEVKEAFGITTDLISEDDDKIKEEF